MEDAAESVSLDAGPWTRTLTAHGIRALRRTRLHTLQVNVGKRCNQTCRHCHVDAGPTRSEQMQASTIERILWLLERNPGLGIVDITGGAPELNPHFRTLVEHARALDRHVIDRCNLTVLFEPGQEDTAGFLARNGVEIVASLPCYSRENVERQRGQGVFSKSIEALQLLNELGYGRGDGRVLNLVYNPLGPSLPPDQSTLEKAYRERMSQDFGIVFDHLYTITNMPIQRFARDLSRQGAHQAYMDLLIDSFNPAAVSGVMCRSLLSVGWDGQLYDCDFNQMLQLPLSGGQGTLWEVDELSVLENSRVTVRAHCLACTAGAGSSCGGVVA
ncbi:MAG: arsenosugar biosynthesis radical SAM protein ArsS [Myxococcota bacterium]|nr:arsenosugar biosynthesis radical SAM protein ArsS [Myxococcota bacterium]